MEGEATGGGAGGCADGVAVGPSEARRDGDAWHFWVESTDESAEYVYVEDGAALHLINELGVPNRITSYDKKLSALHRQVNRPLTFAEIANIVDEVERVQKLTEALTS